MGAVGAAKGVVDIDIAQLCQLGGHLRVVLGLALVEARVLQHQHLTRLERRRRRFRRRPGRLPDKLDRRADQRRQVVGSDLHAVLGVGAILRAPKMAHQDQRGAVVEQILDRRQRGADAGVVGDGAGGLVLRDVEVDAHEGFLALPVYVLDRFLIHGTCPFMCPKKNVAHSVSPRATF
jgi:hypothetical protein